MKNLARMPAIAFSLLLAADSRLPVADQPAGGYGSDPCRQ